MRTIVFLLTAWLVSTGCHKGGLPVCVKGEVNNFDQDNKCVTAKVDQYTFQGKTVYVFDPGTCGADMTSLVMDSDCKKLGHLGGFTGNTRINGESFSNAVFVKTVWKKN